MSTPFNISYEGWSDEPSPMRKDLKSKVSHQKMVANSLTSERNKDPKIRKKVSASNIKYYEKTQGTPIERFMSNIEKIETGCWNYKKRHFSLNGEEIKPKEFSVRHFNITGSGDCVGHTCRNSKCVNPEHLYITNHSDLARETIKIRKMPTGDKHHQSKLTEKEKEDVKKMYQGMLEERNGKHKGIATIIHKKYPQVTLQAIIHIIKN